MGAIVVGDLEPAGAFAGPSRSATWRSASGPLGATAVEADEVPLAIDELPLVALLGCFAEGETVVRGAAELRVKESDRIATVVDGLRGLGAEIEALDDGFVVRGGGGLRGGRIDAHGDHRLALLGAVAGLASREGVEVVGMEAADGLLPRIRGRHREPGGDADGRRDRRARRGRASRRVARAVAQRSGSPTSTPARCTGAVALAALRARRHRPQVAPQLQIELGERISLDGRDVSEAIRTAGGLRGAPRGRPPTRRCGGDGRRAAPAAVRRRLGRRGPRHRHRGRAGRRGQGVPDRRLAEARPPPARAELGVDPAGCSPSRPSATSATPHREHSPLAGPTTRSSSTRTGLTCDEVVARIAALVRSRR